MKALSIRQPWAWLIVNGYKDIENRTWSTRMRGPVLIHASKGMTRAEYEDVEALLATERGIRDKNITLPKFEDLERGGIVGIASITGCLSFSLGNVRSPWFFGPYGFTLGDIKALPFVPFKGALGFFDVPDELVQP